VYKQNVLIALSFVLWVAVNSVTGEFRLKLGYATLRARVETVFYLTYALALFGLFYCVTRFRRGGLPSAVLIATSFTLKQVSYARIYSSIIEKDVLSSFKIRRK
jgi:hypothetical protein